MFKVKVFLGLFIMLLFGFSTITADPSSPMPGGYIEAGVTDPAVQTAADFAVQEINKGTLVKIISAQSQVVAGLNYKIKLQIVDPQGQQAIYDVVVFVPLPVTQAPMQLTSATLITNSSSPSNTP